MVRHRPWTPATLRALGGIDGIGVKFLDDCFASTPYKRHRNAAQALLKELLPPPRRSSADHRAPAASSARAARYTELPADFAELVRMLDGELKLITAVDRDGSAQAHSGHSSLPRKMLARPSYQLAHDYLVRPIRQWYERDQGSTRKGRAKLRLDLITSSWIERHSPRQLPSTIELVNILWHVPSSEWSPNQRLLIRAAQHD